MSAILSPCEKYRYVLRRTIESPARWHRPILFIMLNPSTADASHDDPTIRRCMAFAKRDGFTQLTVVNLFALRATDPKHLKMAIDPIGPENDRHLTEEIQNHNADSIVAAWGCHAFAQYRGTLLARNFGPFVCLGRTKSGEPRHPLYLRLSAQYSVWPPAKS